MPKLRNNKKKVRYDLTLPGYNYLGPFNALDKGPPTSKSDAAALEHDKSKDYESPWAYLYYNDADEELLDKLKGQTDYGARIASTYFNWKKKTMPRMNKRPNISPKSETSKRRRWYEDLIPQNTMESAGTSDNTEPASNLLALRSSNGGQSAVANETPVTIPPTITYGFPDTWTCVMPLNLTFSLTIEGPRRPGMLSVRMNSIYDCIANGSTSLYGGEVNNTSTFGSKFAASATTTAATNDSFILSSAGSTNFGSLGQQPAWRPFFSQRYSKYHVMGCQWDLNTRIVNEEASRTRQRGAIATMYHGRELPPIDGLTLMDMMYWKDLDQVEYLMPESAQTPLGANATSLSGRYKPGQHRREVREDEDAKTWTDTEAAPTLQENLAIYFCEAPLSWIPLNDDQTSNRLIYNCTLTLKYIVQWKDLKLEWKYPTAATEDFAPERNITLE